MGKIKNHIVLLGSLLTALLVFKRRKVFGISGKMLRVPACYFGKNIECTCLSERLLFNLVFFLEKK